MEQGDGSKDALSGEEIEAGYPRPPYVPPRGPDENDMAALFARVQGSIESERGFVATVRGLATPVRVLAAFGAIALALFGAFAFGRRVDFDAYPPLRMAIVLATLTLVLAGHVYRQLLPVHRVDSRPILTEWLTLAALFVPVLLAVIPAPALLHPVDTAGGGHDCLVMGMALGLGLVGVLRWLDRAAHADPRAVVGAAAAGGLLANVVLQMHCPINRPLHIALVHAPLGLLLLFLYRRISRRLQPKSV